VQCDFEAPVFQLSFRDAPGWHSRLGAGSESIRAIVVMDSGLAQERAPE